MMKHSHSTPPDAAAASPSERGRAAPVRGPLPLIIGLAVAVALTLLSGLLHGRLSQRWGMDARMNQMASRLAAFPEQIGPWQQEATYELGKSAMDLLDCQGYVFRGYRHRETGDLVKLTVMVGPGSKMSIHIPEICYEASNFTLLGDRERFPVTAAGQQHELWGVRFQVNDVSERKVRVLYGWSTGAQWMAPRMPRWSVAGAPVLYKLQVSHIVNDPTSTNPSDSDALLRNFLQDSMAILHDLINEPANPAADFRPSAEPSDHSQPQAPADA
jgi:hypothetical protein